MKSTANFKGHPIHPILVAFPIAFFTGTVLFDILALVTRKEKYRQTAKDMEIAGIVGALAAAVPGIIDYLTIIPPKSSGKERATKHGLTNISMLGTFTLAYALRQNTGVAPLAIAGIELAGLAQLLAAGWMGGTLVYRNQIGVDIRYANAGKWSEERLGKAKGKTKVMNADELGENQMKLVHINGKRIVVARTEDGFVAFDDHCTHRGGSLAAGSMICGTVQCPWHGSQFDLNTGGVKAGPAKAKIKTYNVTEEEGVVYLVVD